ncbi:hypothetical protein [Mycobacterium sp. TY814]|uniref:hypothetical protein n=1 Tax=unclassified Mycobacterium TaxID=2642494 RepID=UPI0027416A13|nr:hypothetical protein [Mycobacterium sp. TY814]MDP7721410.1 hypothetical protein [Mycobacterium sp. TY814]
MSQLTAFVITVAVESLWYVGGLVGIVGLRWWSALMLTIGVNAVTHPVAWWVLAPDPTIARLLLTEVAVTLAEAAVLAVAVRRDLTTLALLSVGANASSLLTGLVLNR